MVNAKNEWSRRKFVTVGTGAGAAIFINPISTWASNEIVAKKALVASKFLSLDAHSHIDIPLYNNQKSDFNIDLNGEMKRSVLSAICATFAVDRPELTEPGEAFKRFTLGLDAMDIILETNRMKRALTYSDLIVAYKENKPIVIQSVEGGHFLEGQIERLGLAYDRGVRMLGLLHDVQPSPPIGDIYTDPPTYNGLTDFGASIIKECNRLGILIDLTHCSNAAINDALELSAKPVVISHTGLDTQLGNNERMAKMMMPRLISKQQAKIVSDAGGVIGVWTHLADSPQHYVRNLRAMIEVVGIDHVCMGTDTKIAKPKNADQRIGEVTNAAWENQKEGFFKIVVDEMLRDGFIEGEITKIGGTNFCMVFESATIGH